MIDNDIDNNRFFSCYLDETINILDDYPKYTDEQVIITIFFLFTIGYKANNTEKKTNQLYKCLAVSGDIFG